jgi:hypothetical protein
MESNIYKESESFKRNICKFCGFCKDPQPDFCMALYDIDPAMFLSEIVSRLIILEAIPNIYRKLTSFEGFVSLFCHENRCPMYSDECGGCLVLPKMTCYESFLSQCSENSILPVTKERIYKEYSGIQLEDINNRVDTHRDLKHIIIPKHKRKKIQKKLKKLKNKIIFDNFPNIDKKFYKNKSTKFINNKFIDNKDTEVVHSTMFFNSNEAWKDDIERYLSDD